MTIDLPVLSSARGKRQSPARDDGIVIWIFDIGNDATLSVEGATCTEARAQAKAWVDAMVARLTAEPTPPIEEKLATSMDALNPATATVADVITAVQAAIA